MPGTVAVTGSAGYLGSHTVDRLLADGWAVIGIDNLLYGRRENFEHLADHPRFSFHLLDVQDRAALEEACRPADAIIHLAAMKIPRYGGRLDTLLVNSDGTRNVLEVATDGRRKVVLASTSDVYGKSPDLPFHEEGDLRIGPSSVPRWSYAVSKLFDEHLALAWMDERQVPVCCLRFFGSYGPRHHLSWWGGPQSVFMTLALRGEPLTVHGDGLQTRSFTYATDTVAGIVGSLYESSCDGRVLNIGADREITIRDFAELIYGLCRPGEPARIEMVPYESFTAGKRYEDVRRRVPDCSLVRELFGWEAQVSLEDGLARTVVWHREALARGGEPVP